MAVVLRSGFIDDLHSRVHRNHLNNSSYLGFPMISNAQVDRLIAELRTHRPDLPSRDRLLPLARSREEQSSRDGKHVIACWQRKARVIRHAVSCECRIPAEMRWAQPMLLGLLSFMLPAKTDGGRSATAGSQGRESRVVWNASGCIEGDSIIAA
jgi:hypothetical protein